MQQAMLALVKNQNRCEPNYTNHLRPKKKKLFVSGFTGGSNFYPPGLFFFLNLEKKNPNIVFSNFFCPGVIVRQLHFRSQINVSNGVNALLSVQDHVYKIIF